MLAGSALTSATGHFGVYPDRWRMTYFQQTDRGITIYSLYFKCRQSFRLRAHYIIQRYYVCRRAAIVTSKADFDLWFKSSDEFWRVSSRSKFCGVFWSELCALSSSEKVLCNTRKWSCLSNSWWDIFLETPSPNSSNGCLLTSWGSCFSSKFC